MGVAQVDQLHDGVRVRLDRVRQVARCNAEEGEEASILTGDNQTAVADL